jgi:hypothetical protein
LLNRKKGDLEWERFPSGQRGQTVNLLAMPSEVRILPSPPGLPATDWLSPLTFFIHLTQIEASAEGAKGAVASRTRAGKFKKKGQFLHSLEREKYLVIGYRPLANSVFYVKAGVAQLAEHQPSKLRVAGSIPVSRSIVSKLYC